MNAKKAKALRKKLRFDPNAKREQDGAVYKTGKMTVVNNSKSRRALYQAFKRNEENPFK